MDIKEHIGIRGWYEIKATDKDGNSIIGRIKAPNSHVEGDTLIFPNTLTNTGFAEVAGLLTADIGGTGWDYVALGTDNTAPAAAQTALLAEIVASGGERRGGADVTGTRVTTTQADDTSQLVTIFTFTGALAIEEVGIFNGTPAGTMLSRQLLSFGANNGDSMQITYKIQVSA